MVKRIILIISIIIGLGLGGLDIYLFLQNTNITLELFSYKQIAQKKDRELKRLKEEKKKIAEDSDKLKSDALSSASIIARLQEEKEKLQAEIDRLKEAIEAKESDSRQLAHQLGALKKQLNEFSEKEKDEKVSVLKEKEKLEKDIRMLKGILKKERSLYHYNLGVAYAKAKLFDEAIKAYEESLTIDSSNAEAHYNLGLLYDNFKLEPEVAVQHYRKYLELKPDAEDRNEVEGFIENLIASSLNPSPK